MSLWELAKKQKGRVCGFTAGTSQLSQHRLQELGFDKNAQVFCLGKSRLQATCTFQVGDSVFSLARDVAETIVIEC